MHGFLAGLDAWLTREPDVCSEAAEEVAYAAAMEAIDAPDYSEPTPDESELMRDAPTA